MICIGKPVVVYYARDVQPIPAVVMAIGAMETISVAAFQPNMAGITHLDGVPHIDSERSELAFKQELGCWDYCDCDKPSVPPKGKAPKKEAVGA